MKTECESVLGVNFTNLLIKAFMPADSKSAKRQSSHQCLFVLLGYLHVKAAHRNQPLKFKLCQVN